MIPKSEIDEILSNYDKNNIAVATICAHSAAQIFQGARREGLKTIGLCTPEQRIIYDSFPEATPHEYIMVKEWADLLNEENQRQLVKRSAIVIPHGSHVSYLKNEKLQNDYYVPMLGNRQSLEWERDRDKQRRWLEKAGLKLPKEYKTQAEAGKKVFVKFPGAKGGSNYFTAESDKEVEEGLAELVKLGKISKEDAANRTIQEFMPGVRFYPHYFYSLTEDDRQIAYGLKEGRVELMGMDIRIEPIDESYRGLPNVPKKFFDYTVAGNEERIVREKLLADIFRMGISAVNVSKEKDFFPPGLTGPFCIETVHHPETGFVAFEISARIVAGTNLSTRGTPYEALTFPETTSTGRRIAMEIKNAIKQDKLEKIVY